MREKKRGPTKVSWTGHGGYKNKNQVLKCLGSKRRGGTVGKNVARHSDGGGKWPCWPKEKRKSTGVTTGQPSCILERKNRG